jgi:hypothetical protein
MPKVKLDRFVAVDDDRGNPHGFGPGTTDVPDELMPKVEEAVKRRGLKMRKVEDKPAADKPNGEENK